MRMQDILLNLPDNMPGVDKPRLCTKIWRVLQDPKADGGKGNNARVAIVWTMRREGVTESDCLRIIKDNCKWSDFDEKKTFYYIRKIYQSHDFRGNNERREEEMSKDANFFFSPPLIKTNIEDVIKSVHWRNPKDITTKPESIRHFFINNNDAFFSQHAPDCKHENWYYVHNESILTDKHIIRHLETGLNPSHDKPFTLGLHEKNKDRLGKWICYDLDAKDDLEGSNKKKAYSLIYYYKSIGITCMLENASENTPSYHIWLFCDPTDIRILKQIGEHVRQFLDIKCEVFPKCDNGKYGNQVRLPFGLNRKRNLRSVIMPYL